VASLTSTGVVAELVRISVCFEDIADIREDIDQALVVVS
jgi:O-acetylhomoserine/O-acetylserine sulfhydrylase-like pyridoxal-dependent enzyme